MHRQLGPSATTLDGSAAGAEKKLIRLILGIRQNCGLVIRCSNALSVISQQPFAGARCAVGSSFDPSAVELAIAESCQRPN